MNSSIINHKIVVWGVNHHNTLGIIRSLGESGLFPDVILTCALKARSFVLQSKYVAHGVQIDSYDKSYKYIIDNYYNAEFKTILFCSSDISASMLDMNMEHLKGGFILMCCEQEGRLTYLQNKEEISILANSVGLGTPKSWIIENNNISEEISYPCIIKPLDSKQGKKSDIKKCVNIHELTTFLEGRENMKFLVNEFVDKEFEWQLIGCSLNSGDKVIIPGYTKIIRSKSTTNTGFLDYWPINNLKFEKDKCISLIKACGYSGLFSMEFIRGEDGKDYFLEINFRNDGNAYSVTAAGVNLYKIWIDYNLGQDITAAMNKDVHHVLVMPELIDIYQAYSGRITWREWYNDLRRTNVFLYYSKNDFKPFASRLKEVVNDILSSFSRRAYRKVKSIVRITR